MSRVTTLHRAAMALACASCTAAGPPPSPTTTIPETREAASGRGLLCTSFAATPATTPAGDGPLVLRVVLRGLEESRSMCDVLTTRAGTRLDPLAIDRDLREIWRTGLVDDVRASSEPAPGGILVAYQVRPRAEVARVTLEGAPAGVPIDELEAQLPKPGPDDPSIDWRVGRELLSSLHGYGYRHASVARRVDRDPEAGASLVFALSPGAPLRVAAVTFTGLSVLDPKRLSESLYTRVGAAVADDALERDGLVLSAAGYDAGLVQIRVDPPVVSESPDGLLATVTWPVDEGPVYRVGTIQFVGDLRGTSDDYVKESRMPKKGDVFRRSDLASAIARVTAMHAAKGETATVDPETQIDPKTHVIALTLHVTVVR
ncbi:MAG: hypothetical protein U0414_33465 [Polyangiaceae bacterium]